MEIRQKPRQPGEGEFRRAVKRTATLLFLGSLTLVLLAALVYLAATGGGPERQLVPRSEGVELLRAGAGAARQPAKPAVAPAGGFSVLPERSGLQKPRSNLASWH